MADSGGKPSAVFRNPVSLVGVWIALVALANILFLAVADALADRPNPYLAILAYVAVPAVMLAGLALIPIGVWWARRRARKRGAAAPLPVVDLNRRTHIRWLGLGLVGAALFVALSAAGSYRAYTYSESVAFCGTVCHEPMRPQFTAFEKGSHGRVPCVECHVAPGAAGFVAAKLNGTRQLYHVVKGDVPRPIHAEPGRVTSARETCERCHAPTAYRGDMLKLFTRFKFDEGNTPRAVRLLLRVGGGDPTAGPVEGIHWHTSPGMRVEFAATDATLQEIPWVRVSRADGTTVEYRAEGADLSPEQLAAMPVRTMECLDCHNRTGHPFEPPAHAVDAAMQAGRIDPSLPFVKREAVARLTEGYETTEAAREAILKGLPAFYESEYPQVYAAKREAIEAAAREVARIYEANVFPEMKSDWQSHPSHLSHLVSPGCFRCHDGRHASADGKTISNDCELCHVTVEQREGRQVFAAASGQAFKHPGDVEDFAASPCNNCHTGGLDE